MKLFRLLVLFLVSGASLRAEKAKSKPEEGAVSGLVADHATGRPVEYVAVIVKNKTGGKAVAAGATNATGSFDLGGIPFGSYTLTYSLVGAEASGKMAFMLDAQHRTVNLGRLLLGPGNTVQLDQVEVAARREAFYNSIDRKVYNVGTDVRSITGTVSDLLASVPSVQVDIRGRVSLRGDKDVLILIDGKTSAMMGKHRAAVLAQMPAEDVERIEVITNPSAKYKPDGTAGIINLTLRSQSAAGRSGSVRASVGDASRYSAGANATFTPGRFVVHGSASVRQDDRERFLHDDHSHPDSTNTPVATTHVTTEHSRPLSRVAKAGLEYKIDDQTKIAGAVHYNFRDFVRQSTSARVTRTGGIVTKDYDRIRTDPEFEKDLEFTGTFHHAFAHAGEELSVGLRHGETTDQEDNHYANVYRVSSTDRPFETSLIKSIETNTEATLDYVRHVGENGKLEAGYNGRWNEVDMDSHGTYFWTFTRTWLPDASRIDHFVYDANIQAVYATYGHKFGAFGALAGLRFEQAAIRTNQITARLTGENDYNRFYPSLHLSYDLSDVHQLQLNYSHRVHRPTGDDLNPFPQFDDPSNVRVGNPRLRPEEIHSVEAGYQYKNNGTTYLAALYYHYHYDDMTEVRRFVNSATLLPDPNGTTLLVSKENVGIRRSGGLELDATTRFKDRFALNLSGNLHRSEIDATNLGFATARATTTWEAKLNATVDLTKATLVQLNSNYTAKHLTPQGYNYPTFVANIGLRHNFPDKKTAFVLSVSDVFHSLKERTVVDTPALRQDVTRRRSSRIVYAGFIYNFGKGKKSKEELQFDNSL